MSISLGLDRESVVRTDPSVTITIARGELAFHGLKADWERIAAMMPSKTPLFEWTYLVSWWSSFGKKCPVTGKTGELNVYIVSRNEKIIGIFPFFAVERTSPMMPKRLRPIGYSGRLEPYDLTEEPLVVMEPGEEEVVLTEVSTAIKNGLKEGKWDCAIVNWFDHQRVHGIEKFWTRFTSKPGSAYVALPETWEKFRKGLSKSMRDNLPYYPKLLTRHGHQWHVEISETELDWDRAVNELVRLHRLRAALSNDPNRVDHFTHIEHKTFLNDLHHAFRKDTRAYIGLLRADGKVIAAQLYLDDARTLILSYSGHDPACAKYSPLLVLQSEVIKRAIERKIERLDLLIGDADWQERWKPTRDHPINKLTLAPKKPIATIRCINYVLRRESTIWWHKSRLRRWIYRSRTLATLQSCAQAMYLGHARHLIGLIHRLRFHC